MKALKAFVMLICVGTFSTLLATAVVAASPAKADMFNLLINGDKVEFGENTPVIMEGRTLLPLRFVFEQLNGDDLDWNAAEKIATLKRGEAIVMLSVDTGKAVVNGTETGLDVVPIIYNNSTYVPLAFIANAFDMTVHWDADSFTAFIADTALLNRIKDLVNSGHKSPGEFPAFSADFNIVTETIFDGESVIMNMDGKIQQDYANKFQHSSINITIPGINETMTVKTYDDGEAMYMAADDEVLKTESFFGENMLSQYFAISGFDFDLNYYVGLKLEENDGKATVSGNLLIPDKYFEEVLSSIAGMEEISEMMDGMKFRLSEPINIVMVSDRETKLPLSIQMQFAAEALMEIMNEKLSVYVKYRIDMPKIDYDSKFETTVPEKIIIEAVELKL